MNRKDADTAREILVTALEEDFGHLVDGIPEAVDTALEALDRAGYTVASRAPQAATATHSTGDDAGAAHDPHEGAAGRTERCESRHPERGLLCTLPAGHDTHRHVGDAWSTLDRLDGHALVRALDLAEMLTYIADLGTIHRANATFDRLSTALKEATEADQ